MSSAISALNSLLSNSSSTDDLSSILEAALGAASSGIDVNQAVSASLSAAETPEQQWETQESTLQSQESALTSHASTAINQFVSDYNTLIVSVNAQFTDTNGEGEGVLSADPTVRTLQSDLLQSIDYTYTPASGTTTMPNLSSMGITMNSDGTLSVDSATLDNALKNNYGDVQKFFQGAALNGFANSMDQQLTSFTSPGDGAFSVDLKSVSSEYASLQSDITNFQTNVIEPLQAQLQGQYSQAEIALQQLPVEMKNVDAELGINSGSNG